MTQDLSHYGEGYYTRDIAETWFWRHGLLRPDQLAAVCYAMGWPWYGGERYPRREPGLVLSVGAGRGELEAKLETLPGVSKVLGVDPSAGAAVMYEGGHLVPAVEPAVAAQADTVIFCESIEHIPPAESLAVIDAMKPGARLIIVNWPSYHPIEPDGGWDHITRIDDEFYASLSEGRDVVVRWGSHLVLDIR